jgi:hypothetical protein
MQDIDRSDRGHAAFGGPSTISEVFAGEPGQNRMFVAEEAGSGH